METSSCSQELESATHARTRLTPAGRGRSATGQLLAVAGLLLVAGCSKSADPGPSAAADAPAAAAPAGDSRQTGGLLVKSNRAGATVEATPLTTAGAPPAAATKGAANQALAGLAPGNYVVLAHAEGWLDLRTEATVVAGRTTEVVMNFKTGALRLDTEPAGVTVKSAGTVLGKTPLAIAQLPPGDYALTLEYPGWPVLPFKTTVPENGETAETVRLPHGKLTVTSTPAGATVLLGGRALGQTPLTIERLPAGVKKLTLQAKDFPPLETTVTIEDRGEAKLSPALGAGFPELDPAALLRAVWVPDNPDKLAPSFDSVTGIYAPQNGIVKNLHRKKVYEGWLRKSYRYSGTVKAFDRESGVLELTEQKSDLSRYRIVAKLSLAAREDKDFVARLTKDATVAFYGRLNAAEEPRWPSKVITLEFSPAEPLP